jgi:phage recombination protein Bet
MATQSKTAKPAAPAATEPGNAVVGFDDKRGGLVSRMATKMGIEPTTFLTTLKQTAFRQRGVNGAPAVEVTNEQMAMLLHIAEKYDLDPFVKQLYAFPSEGGIVPIVPIDGWIEMINRHPQFKWMEIEIAPEGTDPDDYWTECIIMRKDRDKPTRIREWLKECYRDTKPWNEMPKRMVRHKAIIQCGRVAFGFSGVFDPDEGDRIIDNGQTLDPQLAPQTKGKPVTREPKMTNAGRQPPDPVTPPRDEVIQRISLDQATVLADKLQEEGVELTALLARFEIGTLEDLPAINYDQAKAVIDELSAAS